MSFNVKTGYYMSLTMLTFFDLILVIDIVQISVFTLVFFTIFHSHLVRYEICALSRVYRLKFWAHLLEEANFGLFWKFSWWKCSTRVFA
jgi:hypothetical protein